MMPSPGSSFFTFLRANLVLTPSAVSSPSGTPHLEPSSTDPSFHLRPCFPSRQAPYKTGRCLDDSAADSAADNDDDNVDFPPLTLGALSSLDERLEGLRLVADSLAHMRLRAGCILAFHPLCLTALLSSWAAVYRFASVPSCAFVLACGTTCAYLLSIRHLTSPIAPNEQGVILGARHGRKLVGAPILRLEPRQTPFAYNSSPNHHLAGGKRKSRSRSASLRRGHGLIRAWATLPMYRQQGVGRHLLLAAVRRTKEVYGRDATVGFAQEHAQSVMLLPRLFNGPFRTDEARAARALEESVTRWGVSRRRKR
ncbi:hypothetical protein DCS_00513 [Drechmeria coniospora]|uniref:N-acetyltransferase domain-containing protein n=1 Tax=Drechmeria coniospora TaxID=98403 RepID=A0A151GQL4_DRECN|nr:hypothetical protein DCS_00513 [Drechmeria coniospora]KYK59383.1 hypothetical protein DCS_00513 [Drechmeria coniospora]